MILSDLLMAGSLLAGETFSSADLIALKSATEVKINPDGKGVAGVVSRQRPAGDEPGGSYAELHVWNAPTGESRPFETIRWRCASSSGAPTGRGSTSCRNAATRTRSMYAPCRWKARFRG